jgi:L-fuconolactonase
MTGIKIDAHQHFWKYNKKDYGWINDSLYVLQRDFLPDDLLAEMTKVQYKACISVQARQTLDETQWLLDLAKQNSFIKGVVGWLDLCSTSLDDHLEQFCKNPKLMGIRHVLQDEKDDAFMLRTDFQEGISKLSLRNLIYEILIYPKHLPHAIELVKNFPHQIFVLDHIAKPAIKSKEIRDWADNIFKLAECKNVYVKASGLITEADWKLWRPEDFTPFFDVIWKAFGEDRIMIGSDWPVCLLAGSYTQVLCLTEGYFEKYSPSVLSKIQGDNAACIYQL